MPSNEDFLFVRMMGGLGNQLFQYAFARSTALAMGAEVAMDPRYVWRKGHHTGLAIQAFNIQARLATSEELARFPEWTIKLSRGLRKWVRPTWNQYHELGLAYDPKAQSRKPGEMVSGFWQAERYFAHIRNTLLQELSLKEPLPPAAIEAMRHIQSCANPSVAVHVRRGDYLRNSLTAQRFGVCDASYFQNAMQQQQKTLNAPCTFFVFSDDMAWCQQNLPQNLNMHHVSNPVLKPEHDLILMSQCQHQIISNSTFSWWGAWLNPNHQAHVIAPQPWLDDDSHDPSDIIPRHWFTERKNSYITPQP